MLKYKYVSKLPHHFIKMNRYKYKVSVTLSYSAELEVFGFEMTHQSYKKIHQISIRK